MTITTSAAAIDGEAVRETHRHAHALREPDVIEDGNGNDAVHLYVVPNGYQLLTHDVAKYRNRPARKVGATTVRTADSFVDFVARHGEPGTTLYADDASSTIRAVLNPATHEEPGWGDHTVTLALDHTNEWRRWSDADGKWISQETFAEFVEDSLADFRTPAAAIMLEIARSFEATTKVDFESGTRSDNGQRRLSYKETVGAKAGQKGDIEIPETLTIGLRVFKGGPGFNVTARFRYRINGGNLLLSVKIDRLADLVDEAFAGTVDAVTERIRESVDDVLLVHGSTR
jgi:uncharacterized protein YfdQ (DUF2303 family)